MPAQLILTLHGIGSPHHGVTDDDEPFYWVSRQAFISLLQTIVVTPGWIQSARCDHP